MAVNVSAAEFRNRGFLKQIVDILKDTRLDPRCLEIELTESVLMPHVESANSVLHSLKALGVRLAIDDFGTGWSSLSYLKDFPIDALKVDKSFVQEAASNSNAARIVSAVINIGKSLKHRVIAEGVETPDQLAFLRTQKCDEGQGYYFSRPLSALRFAGLLKTGTLPVLAGSSSLQWARPWLETAEMLRGQNRGDRRENGPCETEQPESSGAGRLLENSRKSRGPIGVRGETTCRVQNKPPKG